MSEIVGRIAQLESLGEIYSSGNAEFVAIYGRRRVGKTFLVRECFKDDFSFFHTGLSPFELKGKRLLREQLQAFSYSLSRYGLEISQPPEDWMEAFNLLVKMLEGKSTTQRQVVFLDELPWMDTPRSGFVTALEHFWNGWGASRENLMLIVCGSATSWMNDKLINNKGGLYGKLTQVLRLTPFTLAECEQYFSKKGISLSRYDILQSYMVFGGIPYYMNGFRKGKSLAQNVDSLMFGNDAVFADEFERLFSSLFVNPDDHIRIVRFLANSAKGFKRSEISEKTGLGGGGLTKILQSLKESDFITLCKDFNGSSRENRYKLTDPFSLFWLRFIDGERTTDKRFWQNNQLSPAINAWRGHAFENLCFRHIPQIKKALGIAGVHTETSSWSYAGDETRSGCQIDMLIDRADRIVNLCEMKFSVDDYRIDKEYDARLRHRLQTFLDVTRTRKTIHMTLVTTFGLFQNEYAGGIQSVVSQDDLFG